MVQAGNAGDSLSVVATVQMDMVKVVNRDVKCYDSLHGLPWVYIH